MTAKNATPEKARPVMVIMATAIACTKTPFIGSVAFHPEQYGPALVDLVLKLVKGEQVPPFRYVEHHLIDRPKAHKTPNCPSQQLKPVPPPKAPKSGRS